MSAVDDGWQRHDLLSVDPAGWRGAIERDAAIASRPLVRDWAAAGRPVMVRRYQPGDATDLIPVAVSLPRELGKPGVVTQLQRQHVLERREAIALADCLDTAPPHWKPTLQAVLAIASQAQLTPRVFGSLMWQHVTGLRYLDDASDLDLLWHLQQPARAKELATAIAHCAAGSALRIDGEFILPDGAGVHWREWLEDTGATAGTAGSAGTDEVLAKTMHRVESRSRRALSCG